MLKYPKTFDRLPAASFDGLFEWNFLLPAFVGSKITPTDIDAVVERKGKFLLFETKSPGKKVEAGQIIMLENLLKLGRGSIFLFILYGKINTEISQMEIWSLNKINNSIKKSEYFDCDSEFVLEKVSSWFKWANRG
jgi:hypothetical protein